MLPSPAWKTLATSSPNSCAHLADPAQHEGQRRDRDRPVQAHVVVDLPHRAEGRLAAQPDALGLVLVRRLAQFHRVVAPGDRRDAGQLFVDLGGGPFDLDDQQRLAIGVAGMGEILAVARMQGRSMNSMATGRTPALMMSATQAPATSFESKPIRTGRAPSGLRQDAQRGLGHDAKLPFGPADHAQKVQPRRVAPWAPPSVTTVPSIRTSVTPSRLFVVTPYFRQCAPPEFIAMLPAMAQASWLEGSGA